MYDCEVGPSRSNAMALRFDSPNGAKWPIRGIVWALRQSRWFSDIGWRLCCDGRVMTGRTNWSRIKQRSRMRRRGVEDVKGGTPIVTPPANKQPRRRLSKAELREQAAAAFLAWREGQTTKNK